MFPYECALHILVWKHFCADDTDTSHIDHLEKESQNKVSEQPSVEELQKDAQNKATECVQPTIDNSQNDSQKKLQNLCNQL